MPIYLLILLGFSASLTSSFMGLGGALILIPTLNIAGIPIVYAIGTIFFFRLFNSLVSSINNFKLSNIDYKTSIIISVGMLVGITITKAIIFKLHKIGLADIYIRYSYIIFLLIMGIIILIESLHAKQKRNLKKTNKPVLQIIRVPPYIKLTANKKISFTGLLLISLIAGFIAGFLGIGGGLLIVPILIYFVGISSAKATGTSLLTVLISSIWGAILYGSAGTIKYDYFLFLSIGAVFGATIGTRTTRMVEGYIIRLLLAITVLFMACSVLLKQFNYTLLADILLITIIVANATIILFFYVKFTRKKRTVLFFKNK